MTDQTDLNMGACPHVQKASLTEAARSVLQFGDGHLDRDGKSL